MSHIQLHTHLILAQPSLSLSFLLFSCFDTLARSANFRRSGVRVYQVGKASRSSRPSAAHFCNPHGSCIKQSGLEPPPATASRQPANRPVTQDAGSAPHDDKRPTRFVGRGLKYSLFLASEAIDKQKKNRLEWYRCPRRCRRAAAARFGLQLAKGVRVITNSPPTTSSSC